MGARGLGGGGGSAGCGSNGKFRGLIDIDEETTFPISNQIRPTNNRKLAIFTQNVNDMEANQLNLTTDWPFHLNLRYFQK